MAFDQIEFGDSGDGLVGFQPQGWVYIPKICSPENAKQRPENVCRLLIRPDTCNPPHDFAPDVAAFADYAEQNGIVLLHPCMGGPVDKKKYPHAPDIESGKLDVYGQLCRDGADCGGYYVQQSAPHMRAIGKMVRRLLGKLSDTSNLPAPAFPANSAAIAMPSAPSPSPIHPMPTLKVDRGPGGVSVAGCSNTADFSVQVCGCASIGGGVFV